MVLDRHATSDIEIGCQVNVTSDGLTINDNLECSESKWLIIDGTVMQGPAILPLHRYSTSWNPPILSVLTRYFKSVSILVRLIRSIYWHPNVVCLFLRKNF